MIKLLDCTLRDGGYINEWTFGNSNIKKMISGLTKAGIEIIECGFLEDITYDPDKTLFNDIKQIKNVLPIQKANSKYVVMTRYGKLDINKLSENDGQSISGIRITFHINEIDEALDYCKLVKNKGYDVFVQPVGTTSYSDEDLLYLLRRVNELNPYAFYIVDTLGVMKKNDIFRLFYLIDHNLNKGIALGYHSHNNLQLSFSNAQELVSFHIDRDILLDSSVYGMGRGAGNLNTELIAEHINSVYGKKYKSSFLLEIVDGYMAGARNKYNWGYSVPYYLAAIHNCHPDYATYLIEKKTLEVNDVNKILNEIPLELRELYNEELVTNLYLNYQTHWVDDKETFQTLKSNLNSREVLIVVPGRSITTMEVEIKQFIKERNPIVIAVQFLPNELKADYVFFSNSKRYNNLIQDDFIQNPDFKWIITSNINRNIENIDFILNYSNLLNSYKRISDNSTLMLLKLLEEIGVKSIYLAGFDGYDTGSTTNYNNDDMETFLDHKVFQELNEGISIFLKEYMHSNEILNITPSIYFNNHIK